MAYIALIRDRRSAIHWAKHAMHVHGGIVANTEISYEMNLGIPQPDKDVVLPPVPGHFGTIFSGLNSLMSRLPSTDSNSTL